MWQARVTGRDGGARAGGVGDGGAGDGGKPWHYEYGVKVLLCIGQRVE